MSYRAQFDLSGRLAVVTGAAGILGRHFCSALAEHGARVVMIDQEDEKVRALAADIDAVHPGGAIPFACDVSDADAVEAAAREIESSYGPISILHNNAATKGREPARFAEPAETYPLSVWDEVMRVNLTGAFIVTKALGDRMRLSGGGTIVNTSSIYGILGADDRIYEGAEYEGRQIGTPPVYAASKAGLLGLTRYFATRWAGAGVRVNALTLGGVESGQNEEFRTRYAARVPLARMARADEVTGALIFLASDASSYVTGQNIIVDGGLSAW